MQGTMQLSIWHYGHRHGDDVLTVLTEEGHQPTKQEVIDATQIDWEGDERDDEWLDHVINLPLDAAVLADPNGYALPVIRRPATTAPSINSADQTVA